jgi:hypothetical protein
MIVGSYLVFDDYSTDVCWLNLGYCWLYPESMVTSCYITACSLYNRIAPNPQIHPNTMVVKWVDKEVKLHYLRLSSTDKQLENVGASEKNNQYLEFR